MTCADMQEGVLLRDQWYPLPNGSHVYLLQSSCIITAIRGEPLTWNALSIVHNVPPQVANGSFSEH